MVIAIIGLGGLMDVSFDDACIISGYFINQQATPTKQRIKKKNIIPNRTKKLGLLEIISLTASLRIMFIFCDGIFYFAFMMKGQYLIA